VQASCKLKPIRVFLGTALEILVVIPAGEDFQRVAEEKFPFALSRGENPFVLYRCLISNGVR
jgi:hypothetical protein